MDTEIRVEEPDANSTNIRSARIDDRPKGRSTGEKEIERLGIAKYKANPLEGLGGSLQSCVRKSGASLSEGANREEAHEREIHHRRSQR